MDSLTLAPTIPRGRPRSVSDPQKVFPLAKVALEAKALTRPDQAI